MKRCFRGEIWIASIVETRLGSEQNGYRPVLIIQNDIGNKHSPTVIVAMISASPNKFNDMPTHVFVGKHEAGLSADSVIMLEQIRTIDKVRLSRKVGMLTEETMADIDRTIKISLGVAT